MRRWKHQYDAHAETLVKWLTQRTNIFVNTLRLCCKSQTSSSCWYGPAELRNPTSSPTLRCPTWSRGPWRCCPVWTGAQEHLPRPLRTSGGLWGRPCPLRESEACFTLQRTDNDFLFLNMMYSYLSFLFYPLMKYIFLHQKCKSWITMCLKNY